MRNRRDFGETIEGRQFGKLVVIGDTGKLTSNNQRIFIARHIETGAIIESTYTRIKRGETTGYIGSNEHFKKIETTLLNNESKNKSKERCFINGTCIQIFQDIVRKTSKSGYNGVHYNKFKNRWTVQLELAGVSNTKYFSDFKDAVLFVNDFRINYINPLMTEDYRKYEKLNKSQIKMNDYVLEKQKQIDIGIKKEKISKKMTDIKKAEKAKGVRFKNNKWEAGVSIDGKRKYLGRFPTEQQAIEARQKAVNEQIKKLENEMERI